MNQKQMTQLCKRCKCPCTETKSLLGNEIRDQGSVYVELM